MPTQTLKEALLTLAVRNAPVKNTSRTVIRDPKNQSPATFFRDLIQPLAEIQLLEKEEKYAVVLKVIEDPSKIAVKTKIYAIPALRDSELIENAEIFASEDVDYDKFQHLIFYPASADVIKQKIPSPNEKIRVYLAKNYPNHVITNPQDNIYLGIYDDGVSITAGTAGVPTQAQDDQAFKIAAKKSFLDSAPKGAVPANDKLALPYDPSKLKPGEEIAISSTTGLRKDPNNPGAYQIHRGLDIGMPIGTPVLAPTDMIITGINSDRPTADGGLHIYAKQADSAGNPLPDGYTYKFYHLNKVSVAQDQPVAKGQPIGESGNTAALKADGSSTSTGPHLHFEMESTSEQGLKRAERKFFNPLYFIDGKIKISDGIKNKFNFTSNELTLPLTPGNEPFAPEPQTPTPQAPSAAPQEPMSSEPPPEPVTPAPATPASVTPMGNQSRVSSNPTEPKASQSPFTTRPKMLILSLETDYAKGIRQDINIGSRQIKIREDIFEAVSNIKSTLNKYDIPFTCNGYNPSISDKNLSVFAKVGLEIKLNRFAALTEKMNLNTDDYFIGPDTNMPIGNGFKLKIYAIAKRNLIYSDDKYPLKTQIINVYDIRETFNKAPPKIIKIQKTFLDLTQIFEDYGFLQYNPRPEFFKYSDISRSNWNIFYNTSKIVKGYTYKELLSTVYDENNESIWNEKPIVWDGSKFI